MGDIVVVDEETEEEMQKYEVILPNEDEGVCTDRSIIDGNRSFYMYHTNFTELGVLLPFSSFQMAILNFLRVAPSLLHPNSWGFIRAFELFYQTYNLLCTVRTFLHFFSVGTTTNRSEREVGCYRWTIFPLVVIGLFFLLKISLRVSKTIYYAIRLQSVFLLSFWERVVPLSSPCIGTGRGRSKVFFLQFDG